MTSDLPPNSSATFDALWESLDEEAGVPPVVVDPQGTAHKLAAHQRDTLLPPMPPPEYVQTMMELGEIDDPSDHAGPRKTPVVSAPQPQGRSTGGSALDRLTPVAPEPKPPALGLVLASESELLLPDEGGPKPFDGGAPRAPTAPGRVPNATPPRPGTGHGGRRSQGQA
jgi:hypothetical protein